MFETIEEYIKNLFNLPESELKAQWLRVFNEMAVHTRKRKPEELLLMTRPNENPDILKYRLDNYEPITYGSMNKALDDVHRIVNSINYSVKVDDRLDKYIKTNIFQNFNFDLYLQKIVLKRMIEDPNGFLVWMPSGLGLTDSSVKVQPEPYLLYSEAYVYHDANIFIFEAPEYSPYDGVDGAKVYGKVYWLFTKDGIYKVFQTGPNEQEDWDSVKFYAHKLNAFPVIQLGGDMNAEGYYDSYFCPYLAFGNQAIRQFSDWQAVMVQSAFPIVEQFVTECEVKQVINKSTIGLDSKSTEEKYSVTSELKPFARNPHGTILRTISDEGPTITLQGQLPYDVRSINYISPPVEILTYAGEVWKELIVLAEDALQQAMSYAGDSGKKVELNNEGKYSMITKLGNNYFDNLYYKSLQIMSGYFKNSELDSSIVINKPSTFCIKTEQQIIDRIATLKEKNAPSMFVAEDTVDLARKMFSSNDRSKKMFEVISTYDPLFTFSVDEKDSVLMTNRIDPKVYSASIYFYTLLLQIAGEMTDEVFVQTENKTIYEKFLVKLDTILPKTEKLVKPDGTEEV